MKGSSSSNMQWSFSNMMASQHVSFKSAPPQPQPQPQEPHTPTAPTHRLYPPHFPQRTIMGMDKQPISAHQWHQNDLPPLNHNHSMYLPPGNATNLRTSTAAIMGPLVGSTELRSSPSISTGPCQLTIFYNGSVCVYDNVSPDKAQAIMLLAGNNSDSAKPTRTTVPAGAMSSLPKVLPPVPSQMPPTDHAIVTQLPLNPPPLQNHAVKETSTAAKLAQFNDSRIANEQSLPVRSLPVKDTTISSQSAAARLTTSISPISQSLVVASTSGSEVNSVKPVVVAALPKCIDPSKPDTSIGTTAVKSAVPQARKASLARFLERRKDRVIDASPYSVSTKSFECDSIGFGPTFITSNNTAIPNKQLDTIESRT